MQAVRQEKSWTYEDYCALPEDGRRYEIIDGELYVSPSPRSIHQALSKRLQFLLYPLELAGHGWVYVAPMDVIMPGASPVQPDLIFVGQEQRSIMTVANICGVPMLLGEILSPKGARYDRVTKLNKYAQCGVPHYWILDPVARTLEVMTLENDTYRLLAALEPGQSFRHGRFFDVLLDIDDLFAGLPAEIEPSEEV